MNHINVVRKPHTIKEIHLMHGGEVCRIPTQQDGKEVYIVVRAGQFTTSIMFYDAEEYDTFLKESNQ